MKFFSTNPLILLAQFLGLIVLFAAVVIIGGLLLFNNPLAGFKQASNIPTPTKFKATTVQKLVTEYANYSDGDGIELTVYLTKTAIDAEKLLQSPEWYGLTVYKAKDSPRATAEIYLLSKKGDLRGCESYKPRCFLHKDHKGLKYLEEVPPINPGKVAP
jgi:hypothetical protein